MSKLAAVFALTPMTCAALAVPIVTAVAVAVGMSPFPFWKIVYETGIGVFISICFFELTVLLPVAWVFRRKGRLTPARVNVFGMLTGLCLVLAVGLYMIYDQDWNSLRRFSFYGGMIGLALMVWFPAFVFSIWLYLLGSKTATTTLR